MLNGTFWMMTDAAENGHRKGIKNHTIEKAPMVIELADSTEVGDASRPRSTRRAIPFFFCWNSWELHKREYRGSQMRSMKPERTWMSRIKVDQSYHQTFVRAQNGDTLWATACRHRIDKINTSPSGDMTGAGLWGGLLRRGLGKAEEPGAMFEPTILSEEAK